MNKDIEIGTIVMLSPGTRWTIEEMNPLDTKGVVVEQDSWTYVDWENTEKGLTNAYKWNDDDLIVVENLSEDKDVDNE